MNQQNQLTPETAPEDLSKSHVQAVKRRNRQKNFIFCLILVAAILLTTLCTHSLTYLDLQKRYANGVGNEIATNDELQAKINQLTKELEQAREQAQIENPSTSSSFPQLELLARLFQVKSYYAADVPDEVYEAAVMKAYAEATGDKYAEYYTAAEYAEIAASATGEFEGIGVSVLQEHVEVQGVNYSAFYVLSFYEDSHAAEAGLKIGDYIYAVKDGDEYKTIDALGGYSTALTKIRGSKGTYAEIMVIRKNGDAYEAVELQILRDQFSTKYVSYRVSSTDPSVGIIRISQFELEMPGQLKEAVFALQEQGIKKFVFDLRGNPGGNLLSIQATLSYFLNEGELILAAINRDGKIVDSITSGVMVAGKNEGSCNVTEEEIGMFRRLNMVVLCDKNTASAAEVFVAGIQDYNLAKVVGTVTYGKGIMQTTYPLALYGGSGYAKMTTHAYVTHRGTSYHEVGITPDVLVELSEEGANYSIYLRPENLDDQLQAALKLLK